jgi:hypothetical protein
MTTIFDEKLLDIVMNPANHAHEGLFEIQQCSMIDEAVDPRLFEAHAELAPVGQNGGRACDVKTGPCSCGAWHR